MLFFVAVVVKICRKADCVRYCLRGAVPPYTYSAVAVFVCYLRYALIAQYVTYQRCHTFPLPSLFPFHRLSVLSLAGVNIVAKLAILPYIIVAVLAIVKLF